MTSKVWLSRGRNIDREINALLSALDEARARAESVTQRITGDTVQGSKDPHKYDRLVELENEIDQRVDELYAVKLEIITATAKLTDNRLRELLVRRYVENKSFEQIAVDMGYSWRQTCRLHGDALVKMEEVLHAENV